MSLTGTVLFVWHRWRAWQLRERGTRSYKAGDRAYQAGARDFDRAVDHDFAAERIRRGSGEGDPQSPQPP